MWTSLVSTADQVEACMASWTLFCLASLHHHLHWWWWCVPWGWTRTVTGMPWCHGRKAQMFWSSFLNSSQIMLFCWWYWREKKSGPLRVQIFNISQDKLSLLRGPTEEDEVVSVRCWFTLTHWWCTFASLSKGPVWTSNYCGTSHFWVRPPSGQILSP